MKNSNKKGFTIVELVIVVAVIAILAAVLIPTFSGLVKKANLSADQQAIRNMNTAAAIGAAEGKYENPSDVLDALYANGFNLGKMQTYSNGFHYAYNYEDNKVYLLDEDDNVIYPEEVSKDKLWGFYYDSVEGKLEGVNNYIAMANITNLDNFQQAFATGTYNIDLNGYYIDLGDGNGSSDVTVKNGGYVSGAITTDSTIKEYTKATAVESGKAYSYVVFTSVEYSGVENSTFDNCVFYDSSIRFEGNLAMSNCTFVGGIKGKASIELYGNTAGTYDISITNCTFDNVTRPINISTGHALGADTLTRNIKIDGCKFNGTTQDKYLIQIADNKAATIKIENCEFNSLGSAVAVVRIHDTTFNGGDYVTAFADNAAADAFAAKITFSGNTFGETIAEDQYVDTDGITTSIATHLDATLTNKIK